MRFVPPFSSWTAFRRSEFVQWVLAPVVLLFGFVLFFTAVSVPGSKSVLYISLMFTGATGGVLMGGYLFLEAVRYVYGDGETHYYAE